MICVLSYLWNTFITFYRFIVPFTVLDVDFLMCCILSFYYLLSFYPTFYRLKCSCHIHLLCEKQLWSASSTKTHDVGGEPNGCVSKDYTSYWCVSQCFRCLVARFHASGLSPDNTPVRCSPQSNFRVSNTLTSATFHVYQGNTQSLRFSHSKLLFLLPHL